MPPERLTHETFTIGRDFAASPASVFAAWSDPVARASWSPPSPDEVVIFDVADFSIGGRDISRCGAADDPAFTVHTFYLDIVHDHRIVFTETVSHAGEILSHALLTVELTAARPGGTRLQVTNQIVAIGDTRIISGNRNGLAAALDNLVRRLAVATPAS